MNNFRIGDLAVCKASGGGVEKDLVPLAGFCEEGQLVVGRLLALELVVGMRMQANETAHKQTKIAAHEPDADELPKCSNDGKANNAKCKCEKVYDDGSKMSQKCEAGDVCDPNVEGFDRMCKGTATCDTCQNACLMEKSKKCTKASPNGAAVTKDMCLNPPGQDGKPMTEEQKNQYQAMMAPKWCEAKKDNDQGNNSGAFASGALMSIALAVLVVAL